MVEISVWKVQRALSVHLMDPTYDVIVGVNGMLPWDPFTSPYTNFLMMHFDSIARKSMHHKQERPQRTSLALRITLLSCTMLDNARKKPCYGIPWRAFVLRFKVFKGSQRLHLSMYYINSGNLHQNHSFT